MPVEQLFLMTVGYEFVPRAWTLEGETDESPIRLPLTALLARTDGKWFLFDTGLGPEFRDIEFSRRWYQWGDPEMPGEDPDPLLDQLRQCGVSVDDVDALVMSHFHVDHTGGIRYFADGRPVYVQDAELDFGLSDAAEPAQYRPHYDDPAIAWQRLDGDAELAEGIRAIHTPGHAPGHMSYLIELAESGTHLFAFDAVPMMENVERDAPIAVGSIPEQKPLIRESQDRIVAVARSERARLRPGHCPRTWPALDGVPVELR
jgi:glyoxylase-like metal-dependent hydrolase (beta-lactamase superfamily II)